MDPTLAKEFTLEVMAEHGLTQAGWTFKWSSAKTQFGYCSYRRKTISLSRPLTELNDEAQVLDTILHEVAHALTPLHGHDAVWKAKAAELGATPERCGDGITVPPRWAGVCPTCRRTVTFRHRRPSQRFIPHCGWCRQLRDDPPDEFHPSTELKWVESGLVPA